MKKLMIAILLTVVLTFSCASSVLASNPSTLSEDRLEDYQTYVIIEDFLANHPNRQSGSIDEFMAAQYLFNTLTTYGYAPQMQTFTFYNYTGLSLLGADEQGMFTSQNVVVKKLSSQPNAKTVVVGAHYDNLHGVADPATGDIMKEGAMDNGVGVATLLAIAFNLKDVDLPFNVEFVFFGAEETGLLGSDYYVSQLSDMQLSQILIMINLDCVAAGDNIYIYTEDFATQYQQFFLDNTVNTYQTQILAMPNHKRGTQMIQGYPQRPYYHVGQASDHTSFRAAGVPTAFFFAGNLKSDYFGYVESQQNGSHMHSDDDTLSSAVNRYGVKLGRQMQTVADSVVAVLTHADFVSAVADARSQLVPDWVWNEMILLAIFGGMLVLFAVICFRHNKVLKKQAILGDDAGAKQRKSLFQKPSDEDVFSYRN